VYHGKAFYKDAKMKYTLEQISDRLEIEDLITNYADAIDTQNIDRLDDIFTEDAFIDYSPMGGAVGSYPEVKAFLKDALPAFKNTQHLIANYQIKLDGDRATGKIMCFNPMQLDLGDEKSEVFFLGLWYLDEYIKTAEGWRIAKRSEQKSYDYNTPEFLNFDHEV
jgi:ketosteroid isomerase-like protein